MKKLEWYSLVNSLLKNSRTSLVITVEAARMSMGASERSSFPFVWGGGALNRNRLYLENWLYLLILLGCLSISLIGFDRSGWMMGSAVCFSCRFESSLVKFVILIPILTVWGPSKGSKLKHN